MLYLDLDGTLLSVRARHYSTYKEVLARPALRGVPIPEREYWSLKTSGKPAREVLKRSRLMPTKVKAFVETFEEALEAPEMLLLDEIREGTITALGKLYTKTPICLVTQRHQGKNLLNQLEMLGIAKYFAAVLAGKPPTPKRPDPKARGQHKAGLIRSRYKFLPTEALYIGDTETDVECARQLGFQVWLVEGGHRDKDVQIKAEPDRIVADISASLKYLLPGGRWQL